MPLVIRVPLARLRRKGQCIVEFFFLRGRKPSCIAQEGQASRRPEGSEVALRADQTSNSIVWHDLVSQNGTVTEVKSTGLEKMKQECPQSPALSGSRVLRRKPISLGAKECPAGPWRAEGHSRSVGQRRTDRWQ